jgi:hypothetical protein
LGVPVNPAAAGSDDEGAPQQDAGIYIHIHIYIYVYVYVYVNVNTER